METTTSADFQRKIGHYQDRALVEPVMVTRNGRERVVLISADEFKRLKRRDREVLGVTPRNGKNCTLRVGLVRADG